MNDANPGSSFSPLPPAFNISSRHRKDQVAAGQRAELEHILEPEYKSVSNYSLDDNNAGPSRRKERTAGGLMGNGAGLRSHSSLANFRPRAGSNSTTGQQRQKSGLGGVYVDANGKVHDTEYDPFAGVAEVTRAKSKRRSAFGSDKRRTSDSGSSVSGSSSIDKTASRHGSEGAPKDEEEIRRRRESERKRFEDVASHAAMVRRRSVLSQRSAQDNGRITPSLKSSNINEDTMSAVQNFHLDRLQMQNGRSKSSQGSTYQYDIGKSKSPLSPTFDNHSHHSPYNPLPTVADSDERPVKSTEIATTARPTAHTRKSSTTSTTAMQPPPPPAPVPKSKVEIKEGGTRKITGFDAPSSPMPSVATPRINPLLAPPSARLSASSRSRGSSETSREPRTKPPERPREEVYPETPAQQKKREEKERRQARSGVGFAGSSTYSRPPTINFNHGISARVLPEIQILEDDDPRVIVPADGRTTRVQTKYTQADHVIKPFATGSIMAAGGSLSSIPLATSTKAPSEILDEGQGGYVPTRWARGDKALRVTEDEKEKYRPKEWGGKTGDLAGKPEEWK